MTASKSPSTIAEIRALTRQDSWLGVTWVQIDSILRKDSANGKPYWELKCRDASDTMMLRAWSDSLAFTSCERLTKGIGIAIQGEFYVNGTYGLDAKKWEISPLNEEETQLLFVGNETTRAAIHADFSFITETISTIKDPRLQNLAEAFLRKFGPRFQRAAAARSFHHARRGGLCAHTAQMMRSALGVCTAYPSLNRDLLLTGILFHDVGKLWETCPAEHGFDIPILFVGEMLGHITIGIEIINQLWKGLSAKQEQWKTLEPKTDMVRMHLLHLIASHHGELQFGSPVEPKTPEAIALHYIDNMDAKLEMFFAGYRTSPELTPGIHDRVRPLTQRLVAPLPVFHLEPSEKSDEFLEETPDHSPEPSVVQEISESLTESEKAESNAPEQSGEEQKAKKLPWHEEEEN